MICKHCGANIENDSVFCTNCGASVGDAVITYETPVNAKSETVSSEPNDPGKIFGLISLICGIASAVLSACSCSCYGMFLPLSAGIAGIVFSILGSKKTKDAGIEKNKNASLGLILSIAGCALSVVLFIICVIVGLASGMMQEIMYNMY